MCLPAALANSTAAPFRSSSSPTRFSGAVRAMASVPIFSKVPRVILLGNMPGASAFTVMP